jgi:virulence-associated protein VapD
LDKAKPKGFYLNPQPVAAIADVIFFGREYGALVFRSFDLKQNLFWTEVKSETSAIYQEAKQVLEEMGFTFQAIVIDGRPGVRGVFSSIPIQICQFHQIKTVNKYLTRRPKLEAVKEL